MLIYQYQHTVYGQNHAVVQFVGHFDTIYHVYKMVSCSSSSEFQLLNSNIQQNVYNHLHLRTINTIRFYFSSSVFSLQCHHASPPTRRHLPLSHHGPPHPNRSYLSQPRAALNRRRMPTWMGAQAHGQASAPRQACPTPLRALTA